MVSRRPLRCHLMYEAPTDSQLAYIRDLCDKQGYRHPEVVSSKTEASQIIAEIVSGTYGAEKYAYPFQAVS